MPITWDESLPGDGDYLSQGADSIRTLKREFAEGIVPAMYWPGSGGGSAASAGEMKLGTFKTHYEVRSGLSVGARNGSLLFASDTSECYMIQTSVDSLPVLHGYAIEHPRSAVSTVYWVVSSGTGSTAEDKSFGVTYKGRPLITTSWVTTLTTPEYPIAITVGAVTTTQFTPSGWSIIDVPAVDWVQEMAQLFHWISIGTVDV